MMRRLHVLLALALVGLYGSDVTAAGERYALVVSGASGGAPYAEKYDAWRSAFVTTLRQTLGYPDDHVVVLAERGDHGALPATRENVRDAVARLRARVEKDDVVTVLLIGHGAASDAEEGKFNLVGPDLSASDWAALLKTLPGRLVFVDTASGSSPFLKALAAPGRVVITANDSPAQQFETVFPEFFLKAFDNDQADVDKSGRVSVWEAFAYASRAVTRWFEERGQLATERAVLDDVGDGVGRDVDAARAPDGPAAQTVYLHRDPPIVETADPVLNGLRRRRAALDAELDSLRARRQTMLPDDYNRELERLLLEIARIDRQIRSRS